MRKTEFAEIARKWYLDNPARISGSYEENRLFEALYNSWCRIRGEERTFRTVAANKDFGEACMELFTWYQNRYGIHFSMERGTRGQKRMVSRREDAYTFDTLYCDNRQFLAYLMTDTPQSGNQDLCCFVLHMAVAFMIQPEQLDRVLQWLGFHPLHVKNIHHLAVYAVLTQAQEFRQGIPENYNPFSETKRLYLRACQLLDHPEGAAPEGFVYGDLLTMEIRQRLMLQKQLTEQNFEMIVRLNRDALNMRHSRILEDFHRLTAVYLDIFADYEWEENHYSLYRMVNQFCTEVSEKKFRERMGIMIDKHQKHPTRQMMILLWLYDYCFAFVDGIAMSNETFQKIRKRLEKHDDSWAEEASGYYRRLRFDVYGFIHGRKRWETPEVFSGADFVAWMDEMLSTRYGWGTLNPRLPFDYYVLRLAALEIRYDGGYGLKKTGKIYCARQKLKLDEPDEMNVPHPLYVVERIMEQMKEVLMEEREKLDEKKRKKISTMPLECSVYEQL